jgi:pyruvate dehydrogenase E1 component alpha subunit
MLHAVGLGWAERLQGTKRIALTYFGDGATSEGDFHEAMNFAGVFQVGCIFLCQNNGWAISTPLSAQTASETIAQKSVAYGMPSVRVDGNDLFAVYQATLEAANRARSGGGPTLIEAVTYRISSHSSSDDPSRYRSSEEVEEWRAMDPIERIRLYLEREGRWSREWQREVEQESSKVIEEAVTKAENFAPPSASEMFDAMYAETPAHLIEQRDQAEQIR